MIWVYEEALGLILELIGTIFTSVSNSVLSAFSLDTTMFYAYIPYFKDAEELIMHFGKALCTIIALVVLVKNQLVVIFDEYEEILPLGLKYIFALILCTFSKKLIEVEFTFFSGFYKSLINLDSVQDATLTFVNAFGAEDGISTLIGGALIATGAGTHLAMAGVLLAVIMISMITVSFFKILLETSERYIVINLGMVFSPLCACCIVSKNTMKIFWAYLKTVFSQLLLMCMNIIFIRGALQCLQTAAQPQFEISPGHKAGGIIVWFIFTMGFMRAGLAMDSWMRSLGLDVVQTGGSLFDSITGAAQSMFYMGRTIGGVKGGISALGGGMGKTISNMGARMNNDAIQNFGNRMQEASATRNGITSAYVKAAEKNLAKGADNSNLYDGKKIAGGIANGLSAPLNANAIKGTFGELSNIPNLDNGKFMAQDGKLTGDLGDGRAFELSKEPTDGAVSITDAAGNEWWMQSTGDLPLSCDIGDVGDSQSLSDMCGIDASTVAGEIGDGTMSPDDIMATNQGNGFVTLADASGNNLGSLNPDAEGYNYIASPNFSAYNEALERNVSPDTQMRSILGSGYSDFSSIALDNGSEHMRVEECSVSNGVTTVKTSDQSMYKILPSSEYTGNGGHEISYGGSKGILVECNAAGKLPKSVHRRNVKG